MERMDVFQHSYYFITYNFIKILIFCVTFLPHNYNNTKFTVLQSVH